MTSTTSPTVTTTTNDVTRSLQALVTNQLLSDATVQLGGAEANDVAEVTDEPVCELLVWDFVLKKDGSV